MENNPKKTSRRKPEDILKEIEGKIDDILSRLENAINSTRSSKSLYEQRLDKGGEKNVIEPLLKLLNAADGDIRKISDELKELFKEHEITINQNKVWMKLTRRSKPIEVKGNLAEKILKIERQQLINNYSEEEMAFVEKIEEKILHILCIFDEDDHLTTDLRDDNDGGFFISSVSTISVPGQGNTVDLLQSLKVEVTEIPKYDSVLRIDDKKNIKVTLPYPFVRIISLNSKDAFFGELQIIEETEKKEDLKLRFFADYSDNVNIRQNLRKNNISIVSKVENGKTVFFAQQSEKGRIQTSLKIDEVLAKNIVEYMASEINLLEEIMSGAELPEGKKENDGKFDKDKKIDENDKIFYFVYQFCFAAYARGYEIEYGQPRSIIDNNTIAEEECQFTFTALPFGTLTIPSIDQILQNIFDGLPCTQEEFKFIMKNVKDGNDVYTFLQNLKIERKNHALQQAIENMRKVVKGKLKRIAKSAGGLGGQVGRGIASTCKTFGNLAQLPDAQTVYLLAQRIEREMAITATPEELKQINNTTRVIDSYIRKELGIENVKLGNVINFLLGRLPKPRISGSSSKGSYTAPKSQAMIAVAKQYEGNEPVMDVEGKIIEEVPVRYE